MNRHLLLVCIGVIALAPASPAQNDKPFELKYWKEQPDQAEVLSATFVGGKGTEWFVGGGIQPDGTVILAGNVLGPTFELSVPVKVIGDDLPPPAETKPVQQMAGGKPKLDKDGKPLYEKPSWRHDGVTGFVVRMTPDLKKMISAHRLPWTAGALTSAAVGKDGAIYIAGRATDGITRLGKAEEAAVPPEAGRKDGQCQDAFVAKLSADGSKAEWVRRQRGYSDAPQVAANADGSVRFSAQDVRDYDRSGKLLRSTVVPGGVKKTTSISPIDGSIVTGGEHHSPTGREPWRCPTLNVHEPDGKLRHQLYDWGGPLVGLDNLRLVSDTAVRFVTHDSKGNILLYAWSDGGNSVMTKQPFDVRTGVAPKGLGITSAGAGVLSCAYLVKIDPKTYEVNGWTIWLAFSGVNKPNSVWIDNLAQSQNGSVLAVGRAALGLWQTKNRLSDALPTGEYIAVFTPDLSGMRYCSVVPGAGTAEVSHQNAGWGIVTGVVDGKERVLFVGGAVGQSRNGDKDVPTPTLNAGQAKFGGGQSDGYVVMLELPKSAMPSDVVTKVEKPAVGPTAASFEKGTTGLKGGKSQTPPDDGTFVFKPDLPKWVTVDAEFRDQAGSHWPTLLYGKPVDGKLAVKGGRLSGSFSVACTQAPQTKGDQGRKILAPLYSGETPPQVKLTLDSFGEPTKVELPTVDNKGKPSIKIVEYVLANGALEVNGKQIDVNPKVTYSFGKTTGVYKGPGKVTPPTDSVRLAAWMTLKGTDLGLKDAGLIDVRIGMSGIAPQK